MAIRDAPIAADAQARVELFLGRVAKIRELAAIAPVKARVLDRPALLQRVRAHVESEMPADVLRTQGEFLIAFGWVPPAYDVQEGAFALLGAQLAGFYEPRDKSMYLAGDLDEAAADATLAHELVHALQDQHFDLGARLSYQPEQNDRMSALQALAEGDATSAMADLMLSDAHRRAIDVPDEVFATQVESSMASSPESASVPRVLSNSLAAPYVDGTAFVHALRRRELARGTSASGWPGVDAAWKRPPETTEQLLHLDKFDAHEAPEQLGPVPPPPGGGWDPVYDDVFGEEGVRIALREWMSGASASNVASGWGGDRAVVFRHAQDGAFAAGWHLRYDAAPGRDSELYAKRAYDAIARAVTGASHRAAATFACRDRIDLGPLAVRRSGRDLSIVAGPYRREGGHVTAIAQCAAVAPWAVAVGTAGRQ